MDAHYNLLKKTVIAIIILILFIPIQCFSYDISFDMDYLLDRFSERQDTGEIALPTCPGCNVIIISLDTLRADRMGLYGYNRNTTPFLDALSSHMIIFNNTFSPASHTLAGHMSIFTSRYPLEHKMNKRDDPPLSRNIPTLPEILGSNGYKTIWIGQLNDPNLDLNRGFERGFDIFTNSIFIRNITYGPGYFPLNLTYGKYFIFMHSYLNHAPYIYPGEFNQKFTSYDYQGPIPKNMDSLNYIVFSKLKSDFKRNSTAFLKNLNKTSDELDDIGCMFRLYDKEIFDRFITKNNLAKAGYNYNFLYFGNNNEFNKTDRMFLSDSYDNGVHFTDYKFRQIYDLIPADNLNRTIIVITSDHGEELMEHGNVDHQNLYDEVIRVPMIILFPSIKNRTIVNGMVQSTDIMHMILKMTAIESDYDLEGRRYSYGFSFGKEYIRTDEWKLIRNSDGSEELFYLRKDRGEKDNIAGKNSIAVSIVRNSLEKELDRWEERQAIG